MARQMIEFTVLYDAYLLEPKTRTVLQHKRIFPGTTQGMTAEFGFDMEPDTEYGLAVQDMFPRVGTTPPAPKFKVGDVIPEEEVEEWWK